MKIMEIKKVEDNVVITMSEYDAHMLVQALSRYHEIDTFMKGTISDDDTQHYCAEDVLDRLCDVLDMGRMNRITITAGDAAYIDISSRVLETVMNTNPYVLEYAAYKDSAPEDWKRLWRKVIIQIRNRFL